jgi:hypothetical protein
MTATKPDKWTRTPTSIGNCCDKCGQQYCSHSPWPELFCPLTDSPSDQKIKLYCDQLQLMVRRLRAEPSLEHMKAVVDTCRSIESMAFTAAILKYKKAVQVTNNKISWLTPAAVAEHLQSTATQPELLPAQTNNEVPAKCPPTS